VVGARFQNQRVCDLPGNNEQDDHIAPKVNVDGVEKVGKISADTGGCCRRTAALGSLHWLARHRQ
jgi:hypothetical protein